MNQTGTSNAELRLKPGRVLLFKPSKGFVSKAIAWFSWRPWFQQVYSHAAIVADNDSLFEMGADALDAGTRFRSLADLDMQYVDVFKVVIDGDDSVPLEALYKAIKKRVGQKYAYTSQILPAAFFGIVSRLGGAKWVKKRMSKDNPHRAASDVCSTLALELCEEVWQRDFLPNVGDNRATPSDLALSPYLVKV